MKSKLFLAVLLLPLTAHTQDVTVNLRPQLLQALEYSMLEIAKQNASVVSQLDSTMHTLDGGYFPVHEGGRYKCIYWKAFPVPEVFETISFNEQISMSSMVIDTTKREFTPAEAAAFRIYDQVLTDVFDSKHFKLIPNSFASIIPLITKESRKVYINLRSKDLSTCLFGYDWEYTFNEDDQIISKIKAHRKESSVQMASAKPGRKIHKTWTHYIGDEKTREISVPDLATVYFYSSVFRWKYFVFKGESYSYLFDVDNSAVLRMSYYEYQEMINSPKYKEESQ